MSLLVAYFITALVLSFICSLLESVILSVSPEYVALLVKEKKRSGRILRKLKRRINHPLAAILTVNTIANVGGAAGVSTQAYVIFGSEWVAAVSAGFTIMILVCSEIIPKNLGAVFWKTLAPPASYLVTGLIVAAYPVVIVLEVVSRIIQAKKTHTPVSREEFIALAEIGEDEGILHEKEARIIGNLLHLDKVPTKTIMTPRAVVFAVQEKLTVEDIIMRYSPLPFSRIPVYGKNLDDIIGYVLRKELLEMFMNGGSSKEVHEYMSPIFAVPESKPIGTLLDEFIKRREHIFLVVDDYGGTAGIVTLEDAVETLLGVEIVDELDRVEDMRAFALDRWKHKRAKK